MYLVLNEEKEVVTEIDAVDYIDAVCTLTNMLVDGIIDVDEVDSLAIICGGNLFEDIEQEIDKLDDCDECGCDEICDIDRDDRATVIDLEDVEITIRKKK